MKSWELKELAEIMDDYGYFEPDIYPEKEDDSLILFIDATTLNGNPVNFDVPTREFTVSVFDDFQEGEYEYEEDEWEDDIDELAIKAYEAVRLARDLARKKK